MLTDGWYLLSFHSWERRPSKIYLARYGIAPSPTAETPQHLLPEETGSHLSALERTCCTVLVLEEATRRPFVLHSVRVGYRNIVPAQFVR